MQEYIHLIGVEDIRSASNTIRQAADDMRMAANTISESVHTHARLMEDFVSRLESAINKMTNNKS